MTIIVHNKSYRHRCYAYKDHLPHPSGGFQSEAYICGDIPAHYGVPAIIYTWDYDPPCLNDPASMMLWEWYSSQDECECIKIIWADGVITQ